MCVRVYVCGGDREHLEKFIFFYVCKAFGVCVCLYLYVRMKPWSACVCVFMHVLSEFCVQQPGNLFIFLFDFTFWCVVLSLSLFYSVDF